MENSINTMVNCKHGIFLNLTDPDLAVTFLLTPTEELFFTWILPAVLFTCLFGNSAFIFTVFRGKNMQNVTNSYLVNVAVPDIILVALAVIPYVYASFISPVRNISIYRSFVGCMLVYHPIYTCYFASILLMTFVTVERYYAICKPLQLRRISSKSRTKKIILACWIAGAILSACVTPRYSGFLTQCVKWLDSNEFQNFPRTIYFCYIPHPDTFLPSELIQTAAFFLGMFVNIFLYTGIIRALSQRPVLANKSETVANEVQQRQSLRVCNQVARLLIINGTVFFLCQTPYRFTAIHKIMEYISGSGIFTTQQYGILLLIGRCFVFVNSCANPFVYVSTSSFCRDAFLQAIGIRGLSSNQPRMPTVSGKTQSVYVTS